MNDNTVLDFDEFMNRVQNDKELLLELLDIFVKDFHVKRSELQKAFEQSNAQTIQHISHFLKGSCGNISAKSLRRIFVELEDKSRANSPIDAKATLDSIDQEFEALAVRIGETRRELQ